MDSTSIIESNKQKFITTIREHVKRSGVDSLLAWLDSTDFYNAPSSTRYHGAYPGGLVDHSLAVYECLKKKQVSESDETIAIVALLHDLCKVNFYKVSMRNTKDENGKWIQVPFYEVDDQLPMGHGEKSVYMIMKHMQLTDEEALSIRWHMGFSVAEQQFERPAMTKTYSTYTLALKLHEADSEASFWLNK